MTVMRPGGPLLLIAAGALCLPAGATGQERARPDPNSPAGVEYQIPLDQARDDAAGGGKGEAGGDKAPPLFGSCVTEGPSKPAPGASPGSIRTTGKQGPGGAREGGGRVASAPATSEGGSGASVSLIAAAVLIAGGALGLGMRRGMGRTRSA